MKAFFFRKSYKVSESAIASFEPKIGAENYRRLYSGAYFDDTAIATLPKLLKISIRTRKPIAPDVIGDSASWIVSKRFARKLQELEPEIHKFAPVEVFWEESGDFIDSYEWMLVSETVQQFDVERTKWRTKVGGGYGLEAAEDCGYDITFNKKSAAVKSQLIAGRTIWRGAPKSACEFHFCSGEFANFYKHEKMRGLDLIQVAVT